jgi:hypothetical protein
LVVCGEGVLFRYKGEEEGEIGERRGESMARSYIKYYSWNYRQNNFVCQLVSNSVGIINMSLSDI